MRKWWLRAIRSISWFAFRYWWFVWLCLLVAISLFIWKCWNQKEEVCAKEADLKSRMAAIDESLANCCDCDTIPVAKAVDCPDRELVFQVCNSNRAKDDNFDVYLNEQYIGKLELGANDQVGSVFIASLDPDLEIADADFVCPLSKMQVYRFNPKFVKYGENVLLLKNTRNNRNNNEGSIEIRNYLNKNKKLGDPCVVHNLKYQMRSGLDFTATFDYTRCCDE